MSITTILWSTLLFAQIPSGIEHVPMNLVTDPMGRTILSFRIVNHFSLLHDGQLLVPVYNRMARIDLNTLQMEYVVDGIASTSINPSPDGSIVYLGGQHNSGFYDTATMTPIEKPWYRLDIGFSPSGRYVIQPADRFDQTRYVRIDFSSEEIQEFSIPIENTNIHWGTRDSEIVWLDAGEERIDPQGESYLAIKAVYFDPEQQQVIREIDLEGLRHDNADRPITAGYYSLMGIMANGDPIVIQGYGMSRVAYVFSRETGNLRVEVPYGDQQQYLFLSPDREWLLFSPTPYHYDRGFDKAATILGGYVTSFRPDGAEALVWSNDGNQVYRRVSMHDLEELSRFHELTGYSQMTSQAIYGTFSYSYDRFVYPGRWTYRYDLETGVQTRYYDDCLDRWEYPIWISEEQNLLLEAKCGTIRFRDLDTGERVGDDIPLGSVEEIHGWTNHQLYLGVNGSLRCISSPNGNELWSVPNVQSVAMSHDLQLIATRHQDDMIVVRDADTGESLEELTLSVVFDSFGFDAEYDLVLLREDRLASSDLVYEVDYSTGEEQLRIREPVSYGGIRLTPSGRYALSGNQWFRTDTWENVFDAPHNYETVRFQLVDETDSYVIQQEGGLMTLQPVSIPLTSHVEDYERYP